MGQSITQVVPDTQQGGRTALLGKMGTCLSRMEACLISLIV